MSGNKWALPLGRPSRLESIVVLPIHLTEEFLAQASESAPKLTPPLIRKLRASGYDRTIAPEVFSRDRHFLAYRRDRLRELWQEAA